MPRFGEARYVSGEEIEIALSDESLSEQYPEINQIVRETTDPYYELSSTHHESAAAHQESTVEPSELFSNTYEMASNAQSTGFIEGLLEERRDRIACLIGGTPQLRLAIEQRREELHRAHQALMRSLPGEGLDSSPPAAISQVSRPARASGMHGLGLGQGTSAPTMLVARASGIGSAPQPHSAASYPELIRGLGDNELREKIKALAPDAVRLMRKGARIERVLSTPFAAQAKTLVSEAESRGWNLSELIHDSFKDPSALHVPPQGADLMSRPCDQAAQIMPMTADTAQAAIEHLNKHIATLTHAWAQEAADVRGFEGSETIATMSEALERLRREGASTERILEHSCALKDAKAREMAKKLEFDNVLLGAQQAVSFAAVASSFLGDPKLGRKIEVGGRALIGVGTSIAALAAGSVHPVGAALTIASSLMSLVGVFADDEESDALGEMLQQLFESVEQLRKEMHERFDALEEQLDKVHQDLSAQLNEIRLQHRETQQLIRVELEHSRRTQKQIKEQIQSVAQQVDLLFASVRSEQVSRALHEITDPVYCSLNALSIQPEPAQYEAWLGRFKMDLERSAYSAVLTGDRSQATDQDASTWSLSGKQPTEAFFHINALIGHLESIHPQWRDMPRQANMLLWAYPSLALVRLIYLLNPTDTGTIRRNEFDILNLIVSKAKEQEQCLMALKSPEIAAALIAEYKTALLDVASELNALFGDFVTRSNRRLNDELELVRQRAWAGDSEQLNLQELGLKLDYPGWFASFKYLHHSGYHKHHGRHDLTGTCESNYRSAQNNVINEAKKRPPAPRAQALKGILIPRPHADIAIDVSDYDLHRPCVFPVAAGDPILPLYSSDGRYADLRGALIPESLVEAEFLGLGRFEYRYEADLVGKKIMISSCFKANEALITLRRLSLDFEPGPFDRKEALFWGWLGRTSVSFQERSYSYEGTKGNRGGSYYLATSMPIISVSSNSPLMNLVNSAAGPARMDIIEALPANTALMTQKIKEAKSALLLSQLKETYDSATSGPGSTLHAALEKLEAAYQRLQGFSMLALSDAYCAQDVRLAEFFKPDSTVFFSRADILKRLNPHAINLIQSAPLLAATSAARASATALCSAGSVDISQLLTKSTEALSCSLEQPLIAALNEHAGKTGHGFFDGIVAHLSEAQAFYKDRVNEASYRDVFEAHSQTQKQFEQAATLLGIIGQVFSENLPPGVQRLLLEEIQSRAASAHIALAPAPGSMSRTRASFFLPAAPNAAQAAAATVESCSDDEKDASRPS